MQNLKNKKVLITGSSRGIGEACARELANAGYEVILHGKSKSENLEKLSKELNAKSLIFDISNTAQCREVLSAELGENALWGVVLNAGITQDGTFAALSENEWKSVIETNLNSFFNVLNPLILPMARKREGRIVVMSSVSAFGNRGQSNYAASKAGLIGAAKSLAIELAARGICVNVVAPGAIKTDMLSEDLPLDSIKKAIPFGRFGEAREVAALVKFLLSEEASYISKQVIGVNGAMA